MSLAPPSVITKEKKTLKGLIELHSQKGTTPTKGFLELIEKLNEPSANYKNQLFEILDDTENRYTLFVPENIVIQSLLKKKRKSLPSSADLFKILRNHIVKGTYCVVDLKKKSASFIETIDNEILCLTKDSDSFIINGTIRKAQNVKSNFTGSNGNIIFIDNIITSTIQKCPTTSQKLELDPKNQSSKSDCPEEATLAPFVQSPSYSTTISSPQPVVVESNPKSPQPDTEYMNKSQKRSIDD